MEAPAASVTEHLDSLARSEKAALNTGDPAIISIASRELNAELLRLLATLRDQTSPTQAEELYRESLSLQDSEDVRLRLATLLFRSGKFAAAATEAQKVVAAEPNNSDAWSLLGSTLHALNQDKEAAAALSHSLELRPDPSVAYALASALLAAHNKPQADQIFARLLTAAHDGAAMHLAIGDAFREAGYLREAAEQFRLALARDPHLLHGEFFLGLVNLQLNEWGPNPESFLHLRRSVEQNPHEYLSNFYLGALEATDGRDLVASDSHLKAATAADPSQPEAWIYLGQNANRQKHPAEAKTYLRKAIALTGTDESRNNYQIRRAYFTLGRLLLAEGERDEGQQLLANYKRTEHAAAVEASANLAQTAGTSTGETSDANAAENSLSSLPIQAAVLPLLAGHAVTAEETKRIAALRSAEQQLKTMLAGSYNDLGTAEARQGQYGPALHDFQQAEQWETPAPALLRNLGVAAYRVGDSHEAERALSHYFALPGTPADGRARVMLAMAEFDLGRFHEAARSFANAPELATSDPRTAYSFAFSLARSGQAQEANALADKLSAQSLPAEILALVCHVYFDAENYKGSADCYRKVSTADPTLKTAHYFVGESLIHLDQPAEAIPELRQELTLTPDEPNVRTALAFALLQTSHKDEARTLLQQTAASHPEHADSQYQLGKLLLEDGHASEAIPHLEASVASDATKDYVHYQLATAYRKAGRTTEAEREFRTYREIKDQHRNDQAIPQSQ